MNVETVSSCSMATLEYIHSNRSKAPFCVFRFFSVWMTNRKSSCQRKIFFVSVERIDRMGGGGKLRNVSSYRTLAHYMPNSPYGCFVRVKNVETMASASARI